MNLANTLELYANRKLHYRTAFQGLPISVENRKGSIRRGTDKRWGDWATKMAVPYGYIRGTTGSDGSEVDVFIGNNPSSKFAYVVHINKQPDFKTYDEDKVLLGFSSAAEAKKVFLQHYDDSRFFGGMEQIPMEEFKKKVLATKNKPQKLDGKKLEGAIELQRIMAGGPGSGCKGPNCGRKKEIQDELGHSMKIEEGGDPTKVISTLEPDHAGILTPDGKVYVGPSYSHWDLISNAGYSTTNRYDDFFDKGGVRFGVARFGGGFIEFGNDNKEVVERALSVARKLPVMNIQFEYSPSLGSKRRSFSIKGEEKEVIGKVRRWWAENHKEEELAADSGEPNVYPGGYAHIEPDTTKTSPPSLKKPYYVPSPTDPRETDDKFGDVTRRNSPKSKERRDALTRQHTDANMRPLSSTLVQGFPSGTIGGFG